MQESALILKATMQKLDDVLVEISQSSVLGLIKRNELLFVHATAEMLLKILKLPEDEAYKHSVKIKILINW